MNMSRLARLGRVGVGIPLVLALLALAWGMSGSAQADDTGMRLTLNARGDGVTCDAPSEPDECTVPLSGPFTLAVELIDPPSEGYISVSTQVDFHDLTWTPAATTDENVWPDNGLPLRSPEAPGVNTQVLAHGGLTGTSSPLPISHYEGSVVEFTLNCTAEPDSIEVASVSLDPAVSPIGGAITLADGKTILPSKSIDERELDLLEDGFPTTVPVSDLLTINCEEVPPTPTPTTQQPPSEPTATAAAATALPPTGYGGGGTDGGARLPLLIAGVLASAAAALGLSGWRFARRYANKEVE